MNEPCRALMGYVPGRYVENTEPRPALAKRRCRACHARMPDGCRNSGCSPECSEAILARSRGRSRGSFAPIDLERARAAEWSARNR